MGQKVHPYGFRLGYIKSWHSSWYAKDRYAELLHEDIKMRAYIEKAMKSAAVASIDISRTSDQSPIGILQNGPLFSTKHISPVHSFFLTNG